MKKIKAIIISVLIIAIILTSAYIIIRRELRSERIKEIIYQYALKNGIDLQIDNISYRISLNGIFFDLNSIRFSHVKAAGSIERVSLQIDLFRLFRREILISRMILDRPDVLIKPIEKLNENADESKIDLSISSNVQIKNGRVVYDSIGADSIYAGLSISADSKINIVGKADYLLTLNIPAELKRQKAAFNLILSDTLTAKNIYLQNEKFTLKISGNIIDSIILADADVEIKDPEDFKQQIMTNDSIKLSGEVKIKASAKYNLKL